MDVVNAIWKFVCKNRTFTLPMLQKELNLPYAEVKKAVDKLVENDKVKFESGLNYCVLGAEEADGGSRESRDDARDTLRSLFFGNKKISSSRDDFDDDDEDDFDEDEEEDDFDDDDEETGDVLEDTLAKISKLRKRLNEAIQKVDSRNKYDDDIDDLDDSFDDFDEDEDEFDDFDEDEDDLDDDTDDDEIYEDRDSELVEEEDAAGGEDFPENTAEEEAFIERIESEGEAFDGYTGSGYEWLPETSAGYRRLAIKRYEEMCGDKRYLLTPRMREDVRNRLDTEYQEMFIGEPNCTDGVKMEFFSMLILPHGRPLRFSLFRKSKGEFLLRTKIIAQPQALDELSYRRDFYFILKRHGVANRGNYFYLPFDHSASLQTAIIHLYAALCELFLFFKTELR